MVNSCISANPFNFKVIKDFEIWTSAPSDVVARQAIINSYNIDGYRTGMPVWKTFKES